jgi:hypothetical protein
VNLSPDGQLTVDNPHGYVTLSKGVAGGRFMGFNSPPFRARRAVKPVIFRVVSRLIPFPNQKEREGEPQTVL